MGNQTQRERIGELVSKCRELGLTFKEGAERFGIEVWRLYEYNKRRKERLNADSAAEGSMAAGKGDGEESAGTTIPKGASAAEANGVPGPTKGSLPAGIVELICGYRRQHPDEGFRRIEQELKRRHHVVVSRKQIRRTLKAAGLLASCDSSFDGEEGPAKGTRRFEASGAGELYQMDVSYVYLEGMPTLYLVLVVDDYSRFCVGAELCSDQRGDTLIGVLHNACVEHGRPVKLLTDQGSGFYTWSFSQTRFQQYLDGHRIEHLVCDPHSPQTQGKVERLIQTVQKELFGRVYCEGYGAAREALKRYIDSYNYDRAHQGLGGQTPADRFYGVSGEVSRLEGSLVGRKIDTSKGFLAFRIHGRTLSAVCGGEGLQVYLDGVLLKEEDSDGCD